MVLPNQSTAKSAFARLSDILQQWPDVDPESFRLLSQLEASLLDLDNKMNPTKSNTQTLVMPSITAAMMI
jgi:hypothetical protein